MFCHPAFVSAEVGSDTESEALLTEKYVSAVAGVDGPDCVIFGEMNNVSVVFVHVCSCMETLDEVAVFADTFKYVETDAGHDEHVKHDIDRVGKFNTVFCEVTADDTHGVGDDVHCFACIATSVKFGQLSVAFLRIHPVVGCTCVLFSAGADEGTVLNTCDVVESGMVKITTGELFLIEFEHFAACASFSSELFSLFFATVDENDFFGLYELDHFIHP